LDRPITWKLGFSELPIAGGNPPAHIYLGK
jgi:hypothetical protein